MQETPLRSDLLNLLFGPTGDGAAVDEGLTASALQEYLHKVDVRREEVLLTLYATVAERFAVTAEEGEDETAADASGLTAADGGVSNADSEFSAALARLGDQAELAVEDGGAAAGLAALAAQHAALLAAAQETAAAAASVRVAAELQQRLADFDAAVAAGSYSEAAWIAVELQKAVGAVPGSDDTAAAVAARVQPLQQQLLDFVAASWAPDPTTHLPTLLSMQDPQQQQQQHESQQQTAAGDAGATAALLAEAWRGLEAFGLLPQALQHLARRFLEQSVQPILSAELNPSRALSDSPAGSVASSNLSRATAAGGGRGGSSVERQLYKALKALVEQVLCGSQQLAEQLGPLLWPACAAAYITTKLKPIQPQSDAEVELYSRKSSLGSKLEQKAVALHLLPADREGPITRHIKRALNLFLNARRNRFITAARDLLTSSAAQESVTVRVPRLSGAAAALGASIALDSAAVQPQVPSSGDSGWAVPEDPLLSGGEYAISKAAQGAVALMREALAEAVRSGNTALAQAMCGAVVDVAATMVALPPPGAAGAGNGSSSAGGSLPPHPAAAEAAGGAAQQQQQALVLPYPAALRHNDCHYVYQALCSLPYQFSPRLQQLVHRNVNFVNPALRVRQAGQDCLQAMVQQQERELLCLAADLRQFAGLDADGQAGIRYRKTVQQLLHTFRRLGALLRPVLAPDVFVDTAAQLVQAVCRQIMDDIMSLPDISVDESEQIPQILEPLSSGLHDAVLPPLSAAAQRAQHGGDAAAAAAAEEAAWAAASVGGLRLDDLSTALHERTPAVMKLRELCELLDIRLVEIRQRWQDGRLQAIGFSAEEVAHLVCALFEDTDLRRDFLALLESEAEDAALL
ncbi:hypothetical protein ABPG77_010208 [Micractinium sp. CCAP 211/92]